jgi:hypothetical protein
MTAVAAARMTRATLRMVRMVWVLRIAKEVGVAGSFHKSMFDRGE